MSQTIAGSVELGKHNLLGDDAHAALRVAGDYLVSGTTILGDPTTILARLAWATPPMPPFNTQQLQATERTSAGWDVSPYALLDWRGETGFKYV